MTPSEIRMIAFFFDKVIPRGNTGNKNKDWNFIHNLDSKQITYQLTEDDHDRLFSLYDSFAPNKDEWAHVTKLVQTLKDIETVQLTFKLFNGETAFDTEVIIP